MNIYESKSRRIAERPRNLQKVPIPSLDRMQMDLMEAIISNIEFDFHINAKRNFCIFKKYK
jgi:hypothetical protein